MLINNFIKSTEKYSLMNYNQGKLELLVGTVNDIEKLYFIGKDYIAYKEDFKPFSIFNTKTR